MSFCIVQTRKSKRALPSLTAVPTNWVQDKSVFWPPSNLVSLSQCKDSVPDKQIWKKQACKLLGKANSYHQAEELISMLDKMTDSEDALQMDRGTRANPAKKRPKFQSKSYQLAPPAPVPGPSGNVIMKQGSSEISSNSKKTHKQPEPLYSEPFESLTSPINLPNPVIHHVIQPPKTTDSVVQPTVLSCNEVQPSNLNGSDNTNDKICGEEFELFIGSDGKQYAELSNGTFMEITTKSESTNEADPAENHEELSAATIDLEIRKLHDRLDTIEGILSKLLNFMANFEKFMQMRHKGETLSCQPAEDFSEFEGLGKINTVDSLEALEQSLANQSFADKYFRYFHTMFSLNGKRESAPFFRKIIRTLVTPVVFLPYSWKGNKRASKNSPGAGKNHISFEASFPEFIKFVYRVVYAADFSHTKEHNDKLFKDYLRYKNTEYKRFQEGYGDQRASSTRKRKQSKVLKANEAQEISPKRQRSSSKGSKSTSSESCDGSLTSLTS